MARRFTLLFLFALAAILPAHTPPPDPDWASIQQKLDALQAAVAARDIEKASAAASDLSQFALKERLKAGPNAADYLRKAESRVASNPAGRPQSLPWMAKLAFDAGDLAKAEQYAREALASSAHPHASGDSIHDGNMVLGLIAVKKGDIPAAKEYLLAAGKTPGTAITRRFGTNMKLADALARKGEFAAVIDYLESVRKIMTDNREHVDDWIALLKGGRQPDFRRGFAH
jgi:hypothetical protein